jgi:hypothetical protein
VNDKNRPVIFTKRQHKNALREDLRLKPAAKRGFFFSRLL